MKAFPESYLVKATRIAGIAYILIILLGVVKVNLLESGVIMSSDGDAAGNLIANELLFRIGIVSEIIMFILACATCLLVATMIAYLIRWIF